MVERQSVNADLRDIADRQIALLDQIEGLLIEDYVFQYPRDLDWKHMPLKGDVIALIRELRKSGEEEKANLLLTTYNSTVGTYYSGKNEGFRTDRIDPVQVII